MKLSSKQSQAGIIPIAWQPQELDGVARQPEIEAVKQEILQIFQADSPAPRGITPKGSAGIVPQGAGAFRAWTPADLSQLAPLPAADRTQNVKIPAGGRIDFRSKGLGVMQEKVNQLLEDAHNTRAEAMHAVDEAQKQAQEIIDLARSEAEQRFQQAYEQGKAQAEAELASSIQAAQVLLDELDTWRSEMLAKAEPTVINMVQDIARTLFGDGMLLEPKVLQEVLAKVLLRTRTMGNLRIFVNPADASQIDPAWRDFQTVVSGQRLQIIPTEDVKPGGCYIEGDQGSVDARIDTRLDAVMSVFNEDLV